MSEQEQTVFRKIYLTVNAETASLADPATQEALTSSEIPSVFLGETVIFCISLVKSTGEAFPLNSGDTFELCIDSTFRNSSQPMAFSGNALFNVAGDWTSASMAGGKISVRVSCNTSQFAQAVGSQQTLMAWMEIKKYSSGGSSNSVLLLDRVLAKNVVFTNGLEPDALGENYYTKAQVDSIMASGLAIELSSASVITSAAVVSQASSVTSLQSLTVSSGGNVSVSSAGAVNVEDGSVTLSNCGSFIVSGGTVSAGTISSVTVSGGEITSATNVAIGGGTVSQSSGCGVQALSGTVIPSAGAIYTHTLAADESFTFPTPVADVDNAFELHLTQPATAVSFTLPAVTWKFATPDLSTAGKTYQLRFRYLNGAWEGWAVPEMSQYALASSLSNYMPKTGGAFTGTVSIFGKSLQIGTDGQIGSNTYSIVVGGGNRTAAHTYTYGSNNRNNGIKTCIIGSSITVNSGVESALAVGDLGTMTSGKFAVYNNNIDLFHVYNNKTTVGGYLTTLGQHLVSQTAVAITPEHDAVFVHTLADNEALSIVTTSLTSTYNVVFRLRLVQGSTAATGFTLPSNVTWIGTTPTCAAANTTYQLRIEWDGTRLIGQQEYEVANA